MGFPPGTEKRHGDSIYVLSALCSIAAILLLAFANPDYLRHDFGDADVLNDYVVASAILAGVNPYSDLDALAERFSDNRYEPPTLDPEFQGTKRTPRTPGAVVIGSLWVPIPVDKLVHINNLLGAILLVPIIFLVIRGNQHPGWQMLSFLLFFTAGMEWSIRFSTISPFVAFASTFALVGIKNGDRPSSGIALAIAGTLKAFSLILLVLAAAHRRWRIVGWTIGCLGILNLLPILTPQVRLFDAVDALLGASARYGYLGGNMSLTTLVSDISDPIVGIGAFILVMTTVSWWITSYPSNVATDGAILIGIAILFSPLSWPHYGLIFYPVALLFLFSPICRFGKPLAAASLLLAFPTGEPWTGAAGIIIFTVVAVVQRIRLSPHRQTLLAPTSAH